MGIAQESRLCVSEIYQPGRAESACRCLSKRAFGLAGSCGLTAAKAGTLYTLPYRGSVDSD
jgi:hypothetical protein